VTVKRDHQRSRVYAWENRVIAPHDPTFVSFAAAQGMVDAIWSDMGLRFPPAVEPLAPQARATVASANRLSIFLTEQTPSWCLLHEIAHAMTSTADGHSDGHGANFVGIYFQLIVQYLRRSPEELQQSLQDAGIKFSVDAEPAFVGLRPRG
jgi:hypothetical protein